MNEVKVQRSILDLTEQAGGYGWKLSNAFVSGVPDLLIFWPGFVPVVAEVKYFGIVSGNFARKWGVTPLQAERLRRINELGPYGIVLVAVKWKATDYVIGYKGSDVPIASSSHIGSVRSTVRRKGQFDLAPVFNDLGVSIGGHASRS